MNVLQLQHELLQFIEPETFQSVDQVCRPLCHNNCLNLNAQKMVLKNGPSLASFSFIFVFSNKHYNFYNK